MKRPKLVTVVLVAHGVEGAIASVVRDLAVAAYALRSRDMELPAVGTAPPPSPPPPPGSSAWT